jgi:hypothetical protein
VLLQGPRCGAPYSSTLGAQTPEPADDQRRMFVRYCRVRSYFDHCAI